MSIIKPKVFWPITIDSTNRVIPFHEATAGNLSCNIATGTYLSAVLLAAAIQTAMRAAHANVNALNVTVSTAGLFTFVNATAIKFRWSVTTNSVYLILGYTAVDTSPATTQTAINQHKNGFYSTVATADDTLPIRDTSMDVVTRTVAGQTKFLAEQELTKRRLVFRWLNPEKTYIAFESTYVNQAIERWWADGKARFRYWPDGLTEGTSLDYVFDLETIMEFKPKRQKTNKGIYEVEFGLFGYVA